jgi:hypothetical protein
MAEWGAAGATYSTRINSLMNGGGLNGSVRLNRTTVTSDGYSDRLTGGTGQDWFFAHLAPQIYLGQPDPTWDVLPDWDRTGFPPVWAAEKVS